MIKSDGMEVNGSYPNIILMHSPLFSLTHASRRETALKPYEFLEGLAQLQTMLF